ncbi:hypothetical protein J6590_077443 [Homalodisca vitripennis]|nr:hypothetical protein J6590_077443 [Homalodisca vitripennis]
MTQAQQSSSDNIFIATTSCSQVLQTPARCCVRDYLETVLSDVWFIRMGWLRSSWDNRMADNVPRRLSDAGRTRDSGPGREAHSGTHPPANRRNPCSRLPWVPVGVPTRARARAIQSVAGKRKCPSITLDRLIEYTQFLAERQRSRSLEELDSKRPSINLRLQTIRGSCGQ